MNIDQEYIDFAKDAYNQCCNWFGTPEDEDWPYSIELFPRDGCCRMKLLHEYFIAVRSSYKCTEQIKSTISHEMYHRVTMSRNTLRKNVWFDEVLAKLTQFHFMDISGYSEYADYSLRRNLESCTTIHPARLKRIRRSRFNFWFAREGYPRNFGVSVRRLAVSALEELSWETMCVAASSNSWDDWIENIEPSERAKVKQIFGVYFD